jgi:predicted negative regulator of RcsB-dependent stress response
MADRGASKIDRKALRQPDEFVTIVGRGGAWLREHQQVAVVAVGGIVAVGVLFGLLAWNASRQQAQSAARFHEAYTAFRNERWEEASRAFGDVADTFAGSPFGRLARLYRGHALARQQDAAGAETAYRAYLEAAPGTDYLHQIALTDLADAQERAGDANAARATYAEAASLPGPFRRTARLAEARLSIVAGDTQAAQAVYRQELERWAEGPLRAFLESQLPASARPADATS